MSCKISVIKTNEIIMSGGTLIWSNDEPSCVYLEVMGPLDLKWHKNRKRLNIDSVVIARKLHLHNSGLGIVRVRGIVFQIEEYSKNMNQPIILNMTNPYCSEFSSQLGAIFSNEDYSSDMLLKLETHFFKLLKSIGQFQEEYSTSCSFEPIGKIDSRLIRINRYIRLNYAQPLTLQSLADLIKCNPIYLSNMYSRVFKISPIKYLQNIRMSKAENELTYTNLNVNDIANGLGYISSSQFSNLFKRYHGMTPTEFRRMNLTNHDANYYHAGGVNVEY